MLIVKTGKTFEFRNLIWTGNLNDLVNLIEKNSNTNLNYINTVFIISYAKADNVKKNKAQWIYIK